MATVTLFRPQLGLPCSENDWLQWHPAYNDTFGRSKGVTVSEEVCIDVAEFGEALNYSDKKYGYQTI